MRGRNHEAALLFARALAIACPFCGAAAGTYCPTRGSRHHFARLAALVFP